MNVTIVSRAPDQVLADSLAVGLHEGSAEAPAAVQGTSFAELFSLLVQQKELTGSLGEYTPILGATGLAAGALVEFGLGPRAVLETGHAFTAGLALSRKLCARKRSVVAVVLPESEHLDLVVSALTQGLVVGTRGTDLRKSEAARHPFETLLVVVPPGVPHDEAALNRAAQEGLVVGESVNLARDLANTPPAEKTPSRFAEIAREIAVASGVGIQVWNEARIRQERFGGLLGVAAGSDEPPAFVVLEYLNGGQAPTLALVGKGVTFDSGGLSLKPSASMEDMKSDMTGAAVVLSAVSAVARLGCRVNVRGYLALTENMTGGKAMKLGDVLRMRNGRTVEVLNTDAEGRLILADALSYAVESKPAAVVDLATLTGACLVALGTRIAGLFSNDDTLAGKVREASLRVGERVWRMPLDEDFKDGLKSQVADFKNVAGKWGGAITAAKFLQQFVGETPWVHLDIAGPSWADSDSALRDSGGTGCFVRTLIDLIRTETIGSAGNS
ncbi:MAG: leucyl aminopeptidase [Isosphaeraceae bacterium]